MSYQKLSVFFLLFLFILTLTGCFGKFLTPALQDQTGTLYLDTDNLQPVPGQDLTLKLTTTAITDFKGYSVTLSYDPALLQLQEVTEEPFFSAEGETFFYRDIDHSKGSVLIDCALLGRNLAVSGEGPLATLRFTCLREGPAEITFKRVIASDLSRDIPTTQRNLQIESR